MWVNGKLIIGKDRTTLSGVVTLTEQQTLLIYKGLSKGIDPRCLVDPIQAIHLKRIHIAEIIKKWG